MLESDHREQRSNRDEDMVGSEGIIRGGEKKKKRNVPKEHSYYLPWLSSTLCASAMRPLPLLRGPYLSLVIKQAQRFLTQTNHGSTSMK